MKLLKNIRKGWKNLTGQGDNKPKMERPAPQISFTADAEKRPVARAGRNRRARGRDSTIITSRSEIGSRTLLG
jgi:hypothetical protein